MKFKDQLLSPNTILGRIPDEIYGMLWSASWLVVVAVLLVILPKPWNVLAALGVEILAIAVTLWITSD